MLGNPLLLGDDGYQISRSVRIRSSASASFGRTPAAAGNRRTWTWSGWVKRGALGSIQTFFSSISSAGVSTEFDFYFATNNSLQIGYGSANWRETSAVYRDTSAWYHIVLAVDTTQASDSNRILLYVNGVSQTFAVSNTVTQNTDTAVNMTYTHRIGGAPSYFGDMYMADINFIDGQALTPSAFGETDAITGVWKPRRYTGTYGTNGFFLNFSDPSAATAAAIGADRSGNGNNWTPNNISVTAGATYDSMLDVPTPWADGGNGRGNYAVLNPLQSRSAPSRANLEFTQPNAGHGPTVGTIGMTTGKWYWEVEVTTFNSASSSIHIGIVGDNYPFASGNYIGNTATSYAYRHSAQRYNNASASAYGATYTTGDVIGVALDLDAGTLVFYKNNASQGTAYSGLSGTFYPGISIEQAGSTSTVQSNFGQRPFAYTPPSGFRALNTQNLPEPTIVRGNRFMDATLYTGTGATRSVTNTGGFQPSLVWIKSRAAARSNVLFDAVRGIAASSLYSNATNAEDTAFTDGLTAYNASGFSLGADSLSRGTNVNTDSYVAWQWREGATQGFDIVTATMNTSGSTTINHSLGVTPNFVITKNRSGTVAWNIYSSILGVNQYLLLNSTQAATTQSGFWGAPTSTQFTFSSAFANSGTYVAYLFSEVAGFSRFGSYTGNASTDGPFVFCGFRPRWVMIKSSTGAFSWIVIDTARDTANAAGLCLIPNLSNAENGPTGLQVDILSNGFKLRNTDGNLNGAQTYIFAAFAETAFRYALAR